jgi:hypothetical protein
MSLSSDGDSLCYYQFDHSKRKSNWGRVLRTDTIISIH